MTLADGSFWVYRYDAFGQVISGKHYWNDGSPVSGQQFQYGFDDIGNRSNTKSGGDANGAKLRSATYTPNALNQYTQRTVPGSFDILCLAAAAKTVTVNGAAADYCRGEYFQKNVTINSTSSALWQAITTTAGTATTTGNLFVTQTPEVPSCDLDGNLIQVGRWTYTWDGENRLIGMDSLSTAPAASKRKLTFEYDYVGRRIGKKVYVWTGSAHPESPNTTLKFLYDGWNLLAEFDAGNSIVRNYQWGLNLSGSPQGAGGVGGLLSVRPAVGTAQFVGYDGTGNVSVGVDGGTGSQVSSFDYGPFGESVRSSGPSTSESLLRFSTKYGDAETGLIYYGYRFYNAVAGGWLSRDPMEEADGSALYTYTSNDPVDFADPLGLKKCNTFRFDFELAKYFRYVIPAHEEQEIGNIVFRAQVTKCEACCPKNGATGYDVQISASVAGTIQTGRAHPITWAPFFYVQPTFSANFNVQLDYKYCPDLWSGGGCGAIQLGGRVGIDRIIPPGWSVYGDVTGGCRLCVRGNRLSGKAQVTLSCFACEQILVGIQFGRSRCSYTWVWQQSTDEEEIASF